MFGPVIGDVLSSPYHYGATLGHKFLLNHPNGSVIKNSKYTHRTIIYCAGIDYCLNFEKSTKSLQDYLEMWSGLYPDLLTNDMIDRYSKTKYDKRADLLMAVIPSAYISSSEEEAASIANEMTFAYDDAQLTKAACVLSTIIYLLRAGSDFNTALEGVIKEYDKNPLYINQPHYNDRFYQFVLGLKLNELTTWDSLSARHSMPRALSVVSLEDDYLKSLTNSISLGKGCGLVTSISLAMYSEKNKTPDHLINAILKKLDDDIISKIIEFCEFEGLNFKVNLWI